MNRTCTNQTSNWTGQPRRPRRIQVSHRRLAARQCLPSVDGRPRRRKGRRHYSSSWSSCRSSFIKKPLELIGDHVNVPGAFWSHAGGARATIRDLSSIISARRASRLPVCVPVIEGAHQCAASHAGGARATIRDLSSVISVHHSPSSSTPSRYATARRALSCRAHLLHLEGFACETIDELVHSAE